MSSDEISWQELNAYVDGELSAERASAVAEAIAHDADLARQAALLSRLKAAIAASPELPETLHRLPPGRRRRVGGPLAAALALLLLIAGALWLPAGRDQVEPGSPLAAAVALHRELAEAWPPERPLPAAAAPLFPGFPPDLSAARLAAGPVRQIEGHGLGFGSAVQYLGSRGCRVTLIALEEPDADLAETLQKTAGDGLEVFRWRVGAIGYLLLAEGMDPARLATIAETVHQASRRLQPLDDSARMRLADSRRRSAPCRA